MKRIYFDNAATTPLSQEVIEEMNRVMQNYFGNPSSIHHYGREAKVIIENSRKTIAKLLNVSPAEIFFTSGATEANNTAIIESVSDLGVKRIITSPIEHHAVLNTVEHLVRENLVELDLVKLNHRGRIDLTHLEELLQKPEKTLVSLMYANNEIANLLPVKEVSSLCRTYNAFFHSDMVQAMGHYRIDLQKLDVDFATCSAHKFHGPKGTGFLYVNNNNVRIEPFIHGGAQERNMRGGTENIYGIAGMAKAFDLAHKNLSNDKKYILGLKLYMKEQLQNHFKDIEFVGESGDKSLYTILNVLFPKIDSSEMLLFNLDIEGLVVSSGSACTAGIAEVSHVIHSLGINSEKPSIRFSFSKYNTKTEVDESIKILSKFFI
ncbi:MAG: cysteine desulfurase [Chlorobi bacterium]|nr:cysteine desulfurase [Chlorobiota bacterium]